jgi:hypothetical protein
MREMNFSWATREFFMRENREYVKILNLSTVNKGCVSHTVALLFTFKSILRQKKNYGNSNTSPCKNIIFKKSSKRNQTPSR